jgi:hypothetical protein
LKKEKRRRKRLKEVREEGERAVRRKGMALQQLSASFPGVFAWPEGSEKIKISGTAPLDGG